MISYVTLHFPEVGAAELCSLKPGFHMSGKSRTVEDFNFLPTIPDFADISDNRQKSVPDSRETACLFVIGGLEPSNLRDW